MLATKGTAAAPAGAQEQGTPVIVVTGRGLEQTPATVAFLAGAAASDTRSSIHAIGLLLVSALMVVPVATAQQVTRGFRATLTAAMVDEGCGRLLFTASIAGLAPGPDAKSLLRRLPARAAAARRTSRRRTPGRS